ncbi:MAG: hypothetical protein RMK30_03750 [Anaerolineae bacterium]|nr:hypothetical protein [Anaerolineae bacterium]MDW8101972.1 hypothetical protein [Anaerolineae bacterium]
MNPRNTSTGKVLEALILPALEQGGYKYRKRAFVGTRLGGGKHFVDVLAEDSEGKKYLISLKWQQVPGTAEQKVPFEVLSLIDAILSSGGKFYKAYLVLGGPGWRLREFFVKGGLSKYLRYGERFYRLG